MRQGKELRRQSEYVCLQVWRYTMTRELEEAFIKTGLPDVINQFLLLRGVARVESCMVF